MVLGRWSINSRLILAQLVLCVVIVCLRDVAHEMRLNTNFVQLEKSPTIDGTLDDIRDNTGIKDKMPQGGLGTRCPSWRRPKSQEAGTRLVPIRLDGEAVLYVYSAFEDSRQEEMS